MCGGKPSGSSDTWATWIDCAGDLVVFDTASGEEVARKPLPSCLDEGWSCEADDVVGEHVYFTREGGASGLRERRYRFDVSTGARGRRDGSRCTPTTSGRTHARLVLGDSWRTGTAPLQVRFDVVGSRLVPTDVETGPTKAFDAATGSPVHLRLPLGPPRSCKDPLARWGGFVLFEWLDDDTVALAQSYEQRPVGGDIITCHLSDGRCRLVVPAGPPDQIRLVPDMNYPQ